MEEVPSKVRDMKPGKIRSLASALMQRMSWMSRLGMQFGGRRELYQVFGYPTRITTDHLLAKYQRQDLASRIVDMPPEEMWSTPPKLKDMHGAKKKWDDFANKHQLWQRVIQADKLCAFGSFTLLWLGMRGAPEHKAARISSLDDILYVQAYGGDNVKVKTYEDDKSSPRFGQPLTYEIFVGPYEQRKPILVHYSRVVHIVDRPLQGLMFGTPRLEQVYNVLEDLLKVGGGAAELYWLTANRGMQVDVDKEMDLQPDDADALQEELDEFQHQLRRYIRTRGVKITTLGSDVADPTGVFNVLIAILAGTTQIPQRILVGSEAGQLASEQDRANWAEYIKRRAKVFGEPCVLRPIMQKLEDLGYLPDGTVEKAKLGMSPDESAFEWPEFFHMSPLEDANALASKARAVANLAGRNKNGAPLISDEEARVMVGVPEQPKSGDTFPKAPVMPTPDDGEDGPNRSQEERPEGSKTATDTPPQRT